MRVRVPHRPHPSGPVSRVVAAGEERRPAGTRGAVDNIDTSRTSMLDELKKTLDRRAIHIVLANPGSEIMKKLDSSKKKTMTTGGLYEQGSQGSASSTNNHLQIITQDSKLDAPGGFK